MCGNVRTAALVRGAVIQTSVPSLRTVLRNRFNSSRKTEVAGYCQFVDKNNFSPEMTLLRTRCEALANQTCYGQYIACDLENNACLTPECPVVNLTNGWFDGNMNTRGSRKRINCHQRHVEASGAIVTTCINGTWTPRPKCVIKECPVVNLANGWFDNNMNTHGSQKRIHCNQRHVEASGANVTTCINGTWTPTPKCVVKDWRLFIGVPGVGGDIADSWKIGTDTTPQLDSCFNEDRPTCSVSKHFRDPLLYKWNDIGVEKVKVSMYKDGMPAAYVEFGAKDSNLTSWFAQSKIISSDWATLTRSSRTDRFTLDGYTGRRFYILEIWGGCIDPSYMIALTQSGNCEYEKGDAAYPVFLYSKPGPGGPSKAAEMEIADKLVIEVWYSETYSP